MSIRQLGAPLRSAAKPGVNRKRVLFLAGGSVGLVAIWYVVQRRNATDTTTTDGTDTTTTDTSIDPNASGAYGSGYGGDYSTGGSADYSPPELDSYVDPSTGAVITGGGATPVYTPPKPVVITKPTTNAQWAQQASAYLVQQGFDAITVATALGKYFSNQNLTDNQLSVVQAALAAEGNPPNPPPPPHVAPPSGQPTGVTSGTIKPKTPTHFHVVSVKSNVGAKLAWTAATGATGYRLKRNGVVSRTSKYTSIDVLRNGSWQVASTRGTYTSAYSAPIVVKGI